MLASRLIRALQRQQANDTQPKDNEAKVDCKSPWVITDTRPFFLESLEPTRWSPDAEARCKNQTMAFMIPPSQLTAKRKVKPHSVDQSQDTIGTVDVEDAEQFLAKKYFESSYSIKMPLYYFPKTSLSRLESIFISKESATPSTVDKGEKTQHMLKLLDLFIFHISDFDQRHGASTDGQQLGGVLSSLYLRDVELKYRQRFIDDSRLAKLCELKNTTTTQTSNLILYIDECIRDHLLCLKIRETQLQVLLIIEYLCTAIQDIKSSKQLIEPHEAITNQQNPTSLRKRTLIRSRKKKIEKEVLVNVTNITVTKDELYYRRLLNTHLDRLLIWDIVLETKTSTSNKEGSEVAADNEVQAKLHRDDLIVPENVFDNELMYPKYFIKKIVIPYFYHKCPKLVKFIRLKISGDIVSKRARSVSATISDSVDKQSNTEHNNGSKKNKERSKSVKRSKTEADMDFSSTTKPQTAALRSKSIANRFTLEQGAKERNNEIHSYRLLKKATSVSLLLERREIDFSVKKKSVAEKLKSVGASRQISGSSIKKPHSLTRAKSLADTSMVTGRPKQIGKSFSQIEATPAKDPTKNPHNKTLYSTSVVEVSSTPQKNIHANTMNISPSIIIDSPSSSIRITNLHSKQPHLFLPEKSAYLTPVKARNETIISPDIHSIKSSIKLIRSDGLTPQNNLSPVQSDSLLIVDISDDTDADN